MIEASTLEEFFTLLQLLIVLDGEGQHLEGEASDEDRRLHRISSVVEWSFF